MRAFLLAWLWLASVSHGLFCQSLSFPAGLRSYRINLIRIEGLGPQQPLRLLGVRYDGTVVPLFRGSVVPSGADLLCYAYLDEEVRSLELEVRTSSGPPLRLSAPVERPRFSIGVYGFPAGLAERGPWRQVLDARELRPGDVRVLAPGEDPQPTLAAGMHVLVPPAAGINLPAAAGPQTSGERNPWQGYLLAASGAEGPALAVALDERREALIEFKRRYLELPAAMSFMAPLLRRAEPLEFPPATPSAIACTLSSEMLGEGVEPRRRYALIAFSAALLAATAALRRWRLLLPSAALLLAGFVLFTFLSPPGSRALILELALPLAGDAARARPVRLEPVEGAAEGLLHYRQAGIPAGSWKLVYRCLSAPGGEAPLPPPGSEEPLRFNQVPEIRHDRGSLVLGFRNPLCSWSLDEPD